VLTLRTSTEWQDVTYRGTFEGELRGLQRRRETDPALTVEDIEGTLKHLYIMDGSDWLGRGGVGDLTMAATIAAYEQFIAGWKAEI
jgi:hypothetical protein